VIFGYLFRLCINDLDYVSSMISKWENLQNRVFKYLFFSLYKERVNGVIIDGITEINYRNYM